MCSQNPILCWQYLILQFFYLSATVYILNFVNKTNLPYPLCYLCFGSVVDNSVSVSPSLESSVRFSGHSRVFHYSFIILKSYNYNLQLIK